MAPMTFRRCEPARSARCGRRAARRHLRVGATAGRIRADRGHRTRAAQGVRSHRHRQRGRPSPFTQVKIVDTDGVEVADGEIGEIALRGDTVHQGYWNRPAVNEARFLDGGWWRTTDAGRREADGTVAFLGTMTRMIKSAAENIYPPEVEGALTSHPAVKAAAIIGVPDPAFVQSVKAIVVPEDGGSVSEDELRDYCKERIASYKKPRFVEFVDALPTVGGQTDYDALDAAFGGGGYPGKADITR